MNEQERINGVHLCGDTVNGNYKVDPTDYPDAQWYSPEFFYSYLGDLEEGETIFAFFDGNSQEIYDKIKKEYGIH